MVLRRVALACSIVIVFIISGCGSSASTPSTADPGPTAPSGPFANLAGTWTGTLESANASPTTITLTVVQAGSCVDGAWTSSNGEWKGAISGTAGADAFGGFMSFERPGGADGPCSAIGSGTGPASESAFSMAVGGLKALTGCAGALPPGFVVTLHR
jgi:hypothetical protein